MKRLLVHHEVPVGTVVHTGFPSRISHFPDPENGRMHFLTDYRRYRDDHNHRSDAVNIYDPCIVLSILSDGHLMSLSPSGEIGVFYPGAILFYE